MREGGENEARRKNISKSGRRYPALASILQSSYPPVPILTPPFPPLPPLDLETVVVKGLLRESMSRMRVIEALLVCIEGRKI